MAKHFNPATIEIATFYGGLTVPDIRGAFYTLVDTSNNSNAGHFHRILI